MREKIYSIQLEIERRKAFQMSLEGNPVIINDGLTSRVSEPYVKFMQLIARGYFNHEIILNPAKVPYFARRIIEAGIDFPEPKNWDVTVTQRRIIRALNDSSSLEEAIRKTGLDISIAVIKNHITQIKRRGRGGEIPKLPERLPERYSVKVSGRAGNI